jgi:DDE_Tnp_1-associated
VNYKTEAGFEQRAELKSLAASFAEIIDLRKRRGIRYRLAPLLVLIVLAKMCGADKPNEIADWVSERAKRAQAGFGPGLETDAASVHLSADTVWRNKITRVPARQGYSSISQMT